MPKKGHTEEQIVGALQRVESGETVGEVCRGLGISQGTFYAWLAICWIILTFFDANRLWLNQNAA